MLKLLELAESALAAKEECILCSVVRLQGSGYGRVGARMLLTESGQREGYISGGCLEKDLIRRAWSEARHSPKLIAFDTRGNSISPTRYNTGCDGIVSILCQPLDWADAFFVRMAAQVARDRQPARLLTVYRSQWNDISVGDSLIQFSDGTFLASAPAVGQCGDVFQQLLRNTRDSFTATTLDAQRQAIELSVEILEPPKRLVVFGSGDDVQPVVQAAVSLGLEVCVVGRRPETTTQLRFPGAQVHVGDYPALAQSLVADSHTHVLLMTHDLNSDLQLLPILVAAPVGSIGTLGSKRRLAKLIAQLYRRGQMLSAEQIDRIRCPVGLDIGAVTPEEIALSIMSELVALEHGKTGMSLSERSGSVHPPLAHQVFEIRRPSITVAEVGQDAIKATPVFHTNVSTTAETEYH